MTLPTQNWANNFFVTRKYHTKKQYITCHLKVFFKKAISYAKVDQKRVATKTVFYSNNIGCIPLDKGITCLLV